MQKYPNTTPIYNRYTRFLKVPPFVPKRNLKDSVLNNASEEFAF